MPDVRVMVAGGAGFIGTHLIRWLLKETDWRIVNLDKLTYAADSEWHLELTEAEGRYELIKADIADEQASRRLVSDVRPQLLLNLAAETHVDRSIDAAAPFVQTNYVGTHSLLQASLEFWKALPSHDRRSFRYLQVSTDEVFGSVEPTQFARPDSAFEPTSPYAATKAGADLLVEAFHHTYGLPTLVSHCTNNYGPRQFPEKLIPVVIATALNELSIPIYGDGRQIRDWIHVEDHARALLAIVRQGVPGRRYSAAGGTAVDNFELVSRICRLLDSFSPLPSGRSYLEQIEYVDDRPGHDARYALDDAATRSELGWQPHISFDEGLRDTVRWYVENRSWWESAGTFDHERRGRAD